MSNAFAAVGRGERVNDNAIFVRKHTFFDRISVPNGSTTTNATFFTGAFSRFYRNVNNGLVNADSAMWVQTLKIIPEVNVTYASGAAITSGAPIVSGTSGAPAVSVLTQAAEIHRAIQGGVVTFKIGDRNWVDNLYGCSSFPAGPQPTIEGFAATTTATVERVAALLVNGNASTDAKWALGQIPLLPQKPFSVIVDWQADIQPTVSWVLRAEVEGVLVSAANA
jgi:hypothetical protein